MRWRAEFGGVREHTWSRNGMTFETAPEAEAYAHDLLARWTGADIARVVAWDGPAHEPIDESDARIVANYRSAS